MLIYSCWGLTNEHIVNNERTEGRCTTAEMPEFYDNCRHSYHAWAIGGSVSRQYFLTFQWLVTDYLTLKLNWQKRFIALYNRV